LQPKPLSKVKLDTQLRRRHTHQTVSSATRTLEHVTPMPALLVAIALTLVTVILILPR
jgi:hypothetical protein